MNFKKYNTCVIIILICLFLFSCNRTDIAYNPLTELVQGKSSTETPLPDMTGADFNISFIACGDNIIYGGNIKDARSKALPDAREYNFKPQYAEVEDIISTADISFINQETLMCGEGYDITYYPRFNSPQDLGHDLVEIGFDVVNIANNHMLDKGADGLSKTIEFWKGMDVMMIGGYEDSEDFDNIRIVEKNGLRIVFLSYTYATNGLTKPQSSPLIIPYINDDDIIRQTALARERADFVMVSIHWGIEGAFNPSTEQKRVAQLIADCGADAIIGHHPHVLQPIEWLEGKDGNKTLCVYSLGNFLAEQDYDYNMVGGIISFDITADGGSKPQIENVVFIPTVFHFPSNFYTNIIYPMTEYTPELAAVHGVRTYYGHSLSYEKLIKYATDTISPEFLPGDFYEKVAD